MKILLICNTSGSILTFRRTLIAKLQNEGHSVVVISFDGKNEDVIKEMGVEFYKVDDSNRSMNPSKVLTLKKKYFKAIRQIQPDIVFTFMLKPNIFGVRAAKKARVKKIFSMVEGAGDVFINNGLKWKLVRMVVCKMYRKSFKYARKVFFLNNDDKDEFISRKLVKEEQCVVIPGIGVDLEHFAYKPVKNYRTFLMIARMLKTKGVIEYCEAARIVKQKYPDAVFNYLGAEGNLKVSDIQEYIDDGSVNYLGTTLDIRPYIEDCSGIVLPSYREGMPMSIMEAEAVGRAVVATDVPGCRHSVENGKNGLLVKKGDVQTLVGALIRLLGNPEQIDAMGRSSRILAEHKFDHRKINDEIVRECTDVI